MFLQYFEPGFSKQEILTSLEKLCVLKNILAGVFLSVRVTTGESHKNRNLREHGEEPVVISTCSSL